MELIESIRNKNRNTIARIYLRGNITSDESGKSRKQEITPQNIEKNVEKALKRKM